MIYFEDSKIDSIALHHVGNKANDDGTVLSDSLLDISDRIVKLLTTYFTTPFVKKESSEYFHLHHDSDLGLNEVYAYVSKIFADPATLYEQSLNLARHLYEKSTHPNIKGGELYVAYFRDCLVDGETVDGVGLFKSENKETFLRVYPLGNNFEVESEKGVNINRLDKGCLIFNTEAENGYLLSIIDQTNRSAEARYWIDDFLHVRQREDDYYQTANTLSLCKSFVTKELPKQYDVSRAEQVELLNKSMAFFKENESFELGQFAEAVIGQPEVIDSFKSYKADYEQQHEMQIPEQFDISAPAVKKQSRVFKSVIKLDKNFHIYVHGNRQYIQKGYDESTGMHFYRIFFNEET